MLFWHDTTKRYQHECSSTAKAKSACIDRRQSPLVRLMRAARYNQRRNRGQRIVKGTPVMSQPLALTSAPTAPEIPANLNAAYSNAVIVSQTNTEIVLDFAGDAQRSARPRANARGIPTLLFLRALENNLSRYEDKHGEITRRPSWSAGRPVVRLIKPDDDKPTDTSSNPEEER
ncbi:MAG: DUF3467 domain-containing protein [Anaerolineae bacterium]|nr:DUF3467 domain-containing protein [Anaerolineae bacterium]